MSNGYIPIGCAGQVSWNAQCGIAGCVAGPASLGCDNSGGTCTTCGLAGFMSFAPLSDPPDPAIHTIVKFATIGKTPVAVVCHPGPTALPKGQVITHINGIEMTPAGWVQATDVAVKELRLSTFDVRKAVSHEELYQRV